MRWTAFLVVSTGILLSEAYATAYLRFRADRLTTAMPTPGAGREEIILVENTPLGDRCLRIFMPCGLLDRHCFGHTTYRYNGDIGYLGVWNDW